MNTKKTTTQEIARPKPHGNTRTNDIIEDYGSWLLVDISTPKFPNASMAADKDVFVAHEGGRISAYTDGNRIYARYYLKGKIPFFHRIAADTPEGMVTDHIYHYPCEFIDNRRSNLRVVTQQQNMMNMCVRSNNTTGVVGVYWCKRTKKWMSGIRISGKFKNLGYFTDFDKAVEAREKAESKYFGDFAYNGGSK